MARLGSLLVEDQRAAVVRSLGARNHRNLVARRSNAFCREDRIESSTSPKGRTATYLQRVPLAPAAFLEGMPSIPARHGGLVSIGRGGT